MRRDERFAQRGFDAFLRSVGSSQIAWRPGGEPPDRLLSTDGREFAVEITQVMEQVELGGRSMPDQGVNAALLRFAAELKREATRRKVLSGRYLVSLEPIPRMAERRDALMNQALRFLAGTASSSSTDDTLLGSYENGAAIHIKKLSPRGRDIFEMTGPADAKWGGQILHEIAELVQAAIHSKAAKLSSIGLPKILLLIDRYVYASGEEWEAAANAAAPHPFHTIARVDTDGQCQVLFSENERWTNAAV